MLLNRVGRGSVGLFFFALFPSVFFASSISLITSSSSMFQLRRASNGTKNLVMPKKRGLLILRFAISFRFIKWESGKNVDK